MICSVIMVETGIGLKVAQNYLFCRTIYCCIMALNICISEQLLYSLYIVTY